VLKPDLETRANMLAYEGAPPGKRRFPAWLLTDVVLPVVISRAALWIVALLALALLPAMDHPKVEPGIGVFDLPDWLAAWSRYDAEWYLSIARDGYSFNPRRESNIAFAPLLPSLMKLGGMLVGRDDNTTLALTGIVVTNLALLVGIGFFVALARLDFVRPTAARAGWYLLIYPSSLFFSAVYPESLTLCFTMGALYFGRKGRWWLAGALGGLAALVRHPGVLVIIPLAVEYLAQRRFRLREIRPDVLGLGLVLVGWASFYVYQAWLLGDPFTSMQALGAWRRQLVPPWVTLRRFFAAPLQVPGYNYHSIVDFSFMVVQVGLVAASWRFVRPSYALYATVLLALYLSSGRLSGMMRYGLDLFPMFLVLAVAGRRVLFDRTCLLIAGCLCGLFMAIFGLGYWLS
jgi:hypothetical protein